LKATVDAWIKTDPKILEWLEAIWKKAKKQLADKKLESIQAM